MKQSGRWLTPTRFLVLSFLCMISVGTVLLMLPVSAASGTGTRFVDALFTSTSAVCVTGLVVHNTAAYWSVFGQVVILLLIQAGGLGIMTYATAHALVTGRRVTLKERIMIQEQMGYWSLSGLVGLMKEVILFTLVFEAVGALVLGVAFSCSMGLEFGEAAFFGVFHSISAFCNAGFDITGSSLMECSGAPWIIIPISLLIILGGVGFYVIADLYSNKAKWGKLSLHTRVALKMTVILLLVGTVFVYALEKDNPATIGNMSIGDKLLSSWFQSVTPRTAGFNSIATEGLRIPTAFFVILLMFIGASPGGTGGGIKTTTFYSTFKFVVSSVRGQEDVNVSKRRLPRNLVTRALVIVLLSIGLIVTSTLLLTITEDAEFLDILFEVVSAFGTVGLSRGLTPSLSDLGKIVVTITMFAGRVGPLSFMIAIYRNSQKPNIRYPEERVSVG
ncbi:MAG TPA: TrkH family potassium uptake protein [Bacillota bacterium]|nr:TrkH family potassium uptake protein [Bacillota bacterium]